MTKISKIKLSEIMKSRVIDLYHKKMDLIRDIVLFINSRELMNEPITILDIRSNIEKYLISENESTSKDKIDAIIDVYNDTLLQYINHDIDLDDIFYLESANLKFTNFELKSLQKVSARKYALDMLVLEFTSTINNINNIQGISFDIRENGYVSGIALINDKDIFLTSKTIEDKSNQYIRTISIIKSSHNHSTLNHKIKDVSILIDYNDGKHIKPLKFNIHYCENCKTYFDFYDSFYSQYKNINYDNLIININKIQSGQPINIKFISELNKSLLSKLGYKVGKTGLSEKTRQKILCYAIESGLFSISEIKSHLEFCINFFKNKKNMTTSISHWREDMFFISKNQNKFDYSKKKY